MSKMLAPMGPETKIKGQFFDIQSYSVHDGPGGRTLVFLKGCPLRCEWCANPEGLENRNRNLFRVTKCVNRSQGCRRCISACPHNAISVNVEGELPLNIDWSKCQTCKTIDCTKACLVEAFILCGRELTVGKLMEILARDRHFWAGKGGVTFSGGEPFSQKEFLLATLKACKAVYIHTAIETSGYTTTENYLEVMKYIDFAFNDLKHTDPIIHKEKTGVSNELILKNISALANSNWKGRLVLRSPVIENFNDTVENMRAIAAFMNKNGLTEFNLLPFHRLGDSKWKQCGMEYPYSFYVSTPEATMNKLAKILRDCGIKTYIGSGTPF